MRVLTRFADIQAATRDWESFTSTRGLDLDGTSGAGFHQVDFIGFDPPKHDLYRNLVRGLFSARAVAALEPVIRERANSLIDRIELGKPFDFGEAFSFQLPLYLIAHVLGLPKAGLDYLGPCARA